MKHIEIDRVTNREMRMHGDVEFPIGIYSETLSSYDLGYVPWHWHAEMEVYFIVKGILELVTTEGTIYLKSGEGFFANSNELHCMKMGEGKDVQYISIVFNPQVIRNGLSLLLDEKYIFPILGNTELSYLFLQDSKYAPQIYDKMTKIEKYHLERNFGFEVYIRNILSEIWLLLLQYKKSCISDTPIKNKLDSNRIRAMLSFIQQHYSEDISLLDIAETASISVSECCRCFKRSLRLSPIEYLVEYRLGEAAMQLMQTEKSISEICFDVGFNSTSYFANKFRRQFNKTPRAYRKAED